jgi:hypothetical protein
MYKCIISKIPPYMCIKLQVIICDACVDVPSTKKEFKSMHSHIHIHVLKGAPLGIVFKSLKTTKKISNIMCCLEKPNIQPIMPKNILGHWIAFPISHFDHKYTQTHAKG